MAAAVGGHGIWESGFAAIPVRVIRIPFGVEARTKKDQRSIRV